MSDTAVQTIAVQTTLTLPPAPIAGAAPIPPAPKKKKICCACPQTKKVRDECIARNGADACVDAIELHKACLRAEGFNV